jgi:protein phosphatase
MSSSNDTVEFKMPTLAEEGQRPRLESTSVLVDIAGLSDRGHVRPNNEDHFLVVRYGRSLERLHTNLPEADFPRTHEEAGYGMVVADGMGGRAAGEVASKMAITTLVNLILATPDWILRLNGDSQFEEISRRATERFEQIGTAMAQEARANPELHGFGTTMTLALSLGADLFTAHVGDSRAYLARRGRLVRLTHDHTLAQAMADQGLVAQEKVATHRYRHVLAKSLSGPHGDATPDVHHVVLEDGDWLLLCSDGLTEMIPEGKILDLLQEGGSAGKTCQSLIDAALQAGGRDNVTVVAARYSIPVAG